MLRDGRGYHPALPTLQNQDRQDRRLETGPHAVLHKGQPLEAMHYPDLHLVNRVIIRDLLRLTRRGMLCAMPPPKTNPCTRSTWRPLSPRYAPSASLILTSSTISNLILSFVTTAWGTTETREEGCHYPRITCRSRQADHSRQRHHNRGNMSAYVCRI